MHQTRLALLTLFLSFSTGLAPTAAQTAPDVAASKSPLFRIAFVGAAGAWTPELPRLAAQLELLLGGQGFAVEAREILAPGVITLLGRSSDPKRFSRRALLALLDQPQLAAWSGLDVLLSDADAAPHPWNLEGELSFTLIKPEAVTRDTTDLARELTRRHLLQRGTPESCIDDMLRHCEFHLLAEKPSARDPKKLDVRLATRCFAPQPEPLQTARWLALFVPRTRVELRPTIDADAAWRDSLRAVPASASASDVRGRAREASAGTAEARFERRFPATPFRTASDLNYFAADCPFDSAAFLELGAHRDALGGMALQWKLDPTHRERAAAFDAQTTWKLLIEGEVWGSVRAQDLIAGEGILFGNFEALDVELAARAFQPLNPPAQWKPKAGAKQAVH